MVRISGLTSGLDIDSMVNQLMQAEKIPLTKLQQQKQTITWQRDAYRDINLLTKELDTLIFNGISKQSNLQAKKVTSSNESYVSASANASATVGSTSISVSQLASSACWESNAVSDIKEVVGTSQTLKFNVSKPGETAPTEVSIDILDTDTLESVLSKINANTSLGLSAFYDSKQSKVVLTNKATGEGSNIEFVDGTTSSLMGRLGFTGNLTDVNKISGTGTDAKFTVNGYETTRSTNTFDLNGVRFTLNQVTSSPITLSVQQDNDLAVQTIKDFVAKYNDVISKLDSKINEKVNRDYKPLTEEQKKEMSEAQVTQWETMAKSGLLRGDSYIRGSLDEMISDMSRSVTGISGSSNTLSSIGITTSPNYLERGKLVIDEDKLRAALENDPSSVYSVFNNKTDSKIDLKPRSQRTFDEQSRFEAETGFAGRLRDCIKQLTINIESRAGNSYKAESSYTLGKKLIDMDSRISSMNRLLQDKESRYYKQFSAMEAAINKSNAQSAYLANAFGQGN